jgi:hypothetical protein
MTREFMRQGLTEAGYIEGQKVLVPLGGRTPRRLWQHRHAADQVYERTLLDYLIGARRWDLKTYTLARWWPLLEDQAEQEMHVAAVGSAFRRLGSIGSPHLAQVPPSDIRFSAASI